jgi:hypothetical protein
LDRPTESKGSVPVGNTASYTIYALLSKEKSLKPKQKEKRKQKIRGKVS